MPQDVSFKHQTDGYDIKQVNSYVSLLQEQYQQLYEHYNELTERIGELNLKLVRGEAQNQVTVENLKKENFTLRQKIDELISGSENISLNMQFRADDETLKPSEPLALPADKDEILLKTVAALAGIVEKLIQTIELTPQSSKAWTRRQRCKDLQKYRAYYAG